LALAMKITNGQTKYLKGKKKNWEDEKEKKPAEEEHQTGTIQPRIGIARATAFASLDGGNQTRSNDKQHLIKIRGKKFRKSSCKRNEEVLDESPPEKANENIQQQVGLTKEVE